MNSQLISSRLLRLPESFYHVVRPTPIKNPYLIDFNHNLSNSLGFDFDESLIDLLTGNLLPSTIESLATVYAGHQFGGFVPQLGDGRAILIGELNCKDNKNWEIQLKGSGLTAFSRQGDGRAVLRSTIREYLCSEAMHGLGIPTTRALSIFGSKDPVYREKVETTAILARLAPSHIRFGHFEYFYHSRQTVLLKQLIDFVITHYFDIDESSEEKYILFLRQVITRTAELMAHWQSVGFAHGVMNTDNMSVLGLTIDYGPFGFLDNYDPGYICNHSDYHGRYAFDQQPAIGLWNLQCLAQCFTPFVEIETLRALLDEYPAQYSSFYYEKMHKKLGFTQNNSTTTRLIDEFLNILSMHDMDYTTSFRNVSQIESNYSHLSSLINWKNRYRNALATYGYPEAQRQQIMNQHNPKYILRNHLAQIAIDKAESGDFSEVSKLRLLLSRPYDDQPKMDEYASEAPDWAKDLCISCSS